VNTSELVMIDRMFVAEEQCLLERLKEEERRAKGELKSHLFYLQKRNMDHKLIVKRKHYCEVQIE
jgi:hypothetical protein